MAKTRLIIARHGNTFGPNETPTRVGKNTDLPLVESGLEQGRLMGRYLKEKKLIPDFIFTSNLQRTSQTASQAQGEMGISLELKALEVFDEIDYGPDENKTEAEVIARLGEDALKAWDAEAIVPDGWKFNPDEAIKNWNNFAEDILQKHEGKTVLVVTSNGIARFAPYLTGDFEGFRSEYKIKLSTGATSLFEHDPEVSNNWICKEWNVKPEKYFEGS